MWRDDVMTKIEFCVFCLIMKKNWKTSNLIFFVGCLNFNKASLVDFFN